MKPARRQFEKAVTAGLAPIGYQLVPGPRESLEVEFWKPAGEFRLILPVEYHRFYDEAFTGSLYLGRTFTFALHAPGYPREGWQRIGELLPELAGGRDHWWYGFTDENAAAFVEAVPTFEARFLAQPGLRERVAAVEDLRCRERRTQRVVETVPRLGPEPPPGLTHQPKRLPKEVPAEWFWAAEIVLKEDWTETFPLNNVLVEWVGLDAWRCAQPWAPSPA